MMALAVTFLFVAMACNGQSSFFTGAFLVLFGVCVLKQLEVK
jgi:hypothetical protein